mmetsp:Transcript_20716/g.62231  ORF Transcript_20716/g.62231 Transcript_20716/m.62231 type:complete len:312 (-) Transcript_20716:1308-2243(-)
MHYQARRLATQTTPYALLVLRRLLQAWALWAWGVGGHLGACLWLWLCLLSVPLVTAGVRGRWVARVVLKASGSEAAVVEAVAADAVHAVVAGEPPLNDRRRAHDLSPRDRPVEVPEEVARQLGGQHDRGGVQGGAAHLRVVECEGEQPHFPSGAHAPRRVFDGGEGAGGDVRAAVRVLLRALDLLADLVLEGAAGDLGELLGAVLELVRHWYEVDRAERAGQIHLEGRGQVGRGDERVVLHVAHSVLGEAVLRPVARVRLGEEGEAGHPRPEGRQLRKLARRSARVGEEAAEVVGPRRVEWRVVHQQHLIN